MKIKTQRNIKRRFSYAKQEKEIILLHYGLFSLSNRYSKLGMSFGNKDTTRLLERKYKQTIERVKLFLMFRKADASISKIKNMCYISNRSRGVNRAFRLSRMSLKEEIQNKLFIGVTRFPYR
jgi:ribosomal protein S14